MKIFEKHARKYEKWFKKNPKIFRSELEAVKTFLPGTGAGIEIGAGTGIFAEALGIKLGLEPSEKMAEIAAERGIKIIKGKAEKLPFKNESFDYALMITTICFTEDAQKAFDESYRILKPGGVFINAFLDADTKLGRFYRKNRNKSVFYGNANFYSAKQVIRMMKKAGFKNFRFVQTIFDLSNKKTQRVLNGYGKGYFVVAKCEKSKAKK